MLLKLWLRLILTLGACLIPAATPVAAQTPAAPGMVLAQGQFTLTLDGTWLAEQKFAQRQSWFYFNSSGYSANATTPSFDFKIKNDRFYMLRFSYGLLDWLTAYARAGVVIGGKLYIARYYTAGQRYDSEELKTNFVWGAGLKARVWRWGERGGGLVLVVDYLRYQDRDLSQEPGDNACFVAASEGSLDYQQLDLSAVFYWPFKLVTPYVGAAYTYSEGRYHMKWVHYDGFWESGDFTLRDQDNFMPLVGLLCALGPHFSLELRGVFLARTGADLSLSYYF